MAGPKYHPYNTRVSQYFCCPGFLWISTLVPGGERAVLLKSNFPFSTTYAEGFGFDISVLNMFNVIGSWLMRRHHRCTGKNFHHHIVPQWINFSMFGWLAPLNFSCEYVGEKITILLIIVCKKFWVPLKLSCPANVFLVWLQCGLIHHKSFVGK